MPTAAENGAQISRELRNIMIAQRRQMDHKIHDLGLNSQQGRLLSYVASHEGIIQKDLAKLLNRRGASVTSMLQGLEKKGFLTREIPSDNARQKKIYLLPAGKEAVTTAAEVFSQSETEVVKNLSATEQTTLLKLLSKVSAGIPNYREQD